MKRALVLYGLLLWGTDVRSQVLFPQSGQRMTVKATIVGWGEEPPGSGILWFLRRVRIAEYGVVARDIWSTWGTADSLPPVGADCQVTYHFGSVSQANTVEPIDRWHDQAILDDFICAAKGSSS